MVASSKQTAKEILAMCRGLAAHCCPKGLSMATNDKILKCGEVSKARSSSRGLSGDQRHG